MSEVRKFAFTLEEAKRETGVVKLIGRASRNDPDRFARKNNLLFEEKSLSKNHAVLGLKLLDPLESGIHIIDQFRIYIKDLGSTYGIVDLNSQESDPFVVDLKNGERFGLINLSEPISPCHCRAAKLKFQVNIQFRDSKKDIFECLIKDVSTEGSPLVSRPSTYGEDVRMYGLLPSSMDTNSMVSSSSSPSEYDYGEDDLFLEDDSSADDMNDSLESYIIDATNNDQSEDEEVNEDESYTVVNLLSVSELVDDWDIWKSNELEKRADISRGLRGSELSKDHDLLNEDDSIVNLDKREASTDSANHYMKYILLSGFIGFTFGVFGSFGLLAVLANKME